MRSPVYSTSKPRSSGSTRNSKSARLHDLLYPLRGKVMDVNSARKLVNGMRTNIDDREFLSECFVKMIKVYQISRQSQRRMQSKKIKPRRSANVDGDAPVVSPEQLSSMGIGVVLLQAMRRHETVDFLRIALEFLRDYRGDVTRLVKVGLVPLMIRALTLFPRDKKVQHYGWAAIKTMACTEAYAEEFVASGVGELFLSTVYHFDREIYVLYDAIDCIAHLFRHPGNRVKLHRLGVGSSIITAMRQNPETESIQFVGCTAIYRLQFSFTSLRLYAGNAVLDAIRNFMSSRKVVEAALNAVNGLAHLLTNARWLIASGGIELVVSGMTAHSDSQKIQYRGCMILWTVSQNDEFKKSIIDRGVQQVVVAALKNHRKDPLVVSAACGVVTNLSTSRDYAALFLGVRAYESVVNAANSRVHEKDEGLHYRAVSALRNISYWGPGFVEPLREARVDRYVLGIRRTFASAPDIVRKADETLLKMGVAANG